MADYPTQHTSCNSAEVFLATYSRSYYPLVVLLLARVLLVVGMPILKHTRPDRFGLDRFIYLLVLFNCLFSNRTELRYLSE